MMFFFFFSSRRRHTRLQGDWSSDVCSSDLPASGITGGDGLHVVWEEIAGTARAKWLLWTGEQIDARTAPAWGGVSEVVPHERAVDRGIQIARGLAAKPALYRTLQKQTLNLNL